MFGRRRRFQETWQAEERRLRGSKEGKKAEDRLNRREGSASGPGRALHVFGCKKRSSKEYRI